MVVLNSFENRYVLVTCHVSIVIVVKPIRLCSISQASLAVALTPAADDKELYLALPR
jgi:hypothetical protein